MRIAIDIDSTLHDHWPLVAAAAKRRFGVDLPYETQFASTTRRLSEEQLRACIADTHSDAAIAGARPYAHAVETVSAWFAAGHRIAITSHRAERSQTATQRWLTDIGLRHHELYCGDDKVAHCRRTGVSLLIDDSPETILRALDAGMTAATLRHPWNAHVCDEPRVLCAVDWPGLARILRPLLEADRRAS
jgi:FMN phosphatase YigB (HAD superfamily)